MLFLGSIEIDDITEHQKLEALYNLYKNDASLLQIWCSEAYFCVSEV